MALTFQFVRASGLAGSLIGWFGGGPGVSHVDIVLKDGRLLGARMDGGVQIREASYLEGCEVLQVKVPCGPAWASIAYSFLAEQVGKPYDFTAIWAFVLGHNWRDPKSWMCSELGAAVLERAGIVNPLVAPDSKITPDALLLLISALVPVEPKFTTVPASATPPAQP